VTTAAVLVVVQLTRPGPVGDDASAGGIKVGQPVPNIVGTTLDGAPFDLSTLRGRPVVVNFWGPSCVPCRDEFPLFKKAISTHAADGLAVVGVLFQDPPDPARSFAAEFGATWPTVLDPAKAVAGAYRVVARPQSYFVDRQGILRSIQVGEVTEADFERQYAAIAPR
jgi:cytochrome c biogenesis protein CcmG/thiol:disulfide interchange protein DsbE